MGARVDLHLRTSTGATLATAALLNGGFEAEEPHVLVPRRAYVHLFAGDPQGTHSEDVQTAGGASAVLVLPDTVDAWVDGGDRCGPVVPVRMLVAGASAAQPPRRIWSTAALKPL